MRVYKLLWLPLLILVLTAQAASAEQTRFKRTESKNSIHYNYAWLDAEGEKQQFSFSVNKKLSNSQFRHFKALSPNRMTKQVKRSLLKTISRLDPKMGKVKLTPQTNGVSFEVTSKDQTWLDETLAQLNESSESAIDAFLKKEYYAKFSGFGHNAEVSTLSYKPDHRRFILESEEAVKPIADKISELFPNAIPRVSATFLLSWIQTIPYDTIESRTTSNGSGFLPPLRLIDRNRGDCDSKVALMASVMKALYPNLRMAIIYVPQHALIGLNVSHVQDDYIIQIDGLDFTLSEPVGPGQIPYADIAEQSKRYIESNYYQVETLYD